MNVLKLAKLAKSKGNTATLKAMDKRWTGENSHCLHSGPVICAIQSVSTVWCLVGFPAIYFLALVGFSFAFDAFVWLLIPLGIVLPFIPLYIANWLNGGNWRYNIYWNQLQRARKFCKVITLLEDAAGQQFDFSWSINDVRNIAVNCVWELAASVKEAQLSIADFKSRHADDNPWNSAKNEKFLAELEEIEHMCDQEFLTAHNQFLSVVDIPEQHGPYYAARPPVLEPVPA